MAKREPGHIRIYPPFFNSRKYYFNQLRKQIETVIDQFIKGKKLERLADYGSGNSPYEPFFSGHTNEYISMDFDENPAIAVPLNRDGTIPGYDRHFDIVLSTQVLEHVSDPLKYLSEAARVLKNEGLLILSTHGYWMFHPDPADYWRWTSAGLKKIVSEAGFEIMYFRGILGRNASGLQLFQDGFLFKLPPFIRPLWSVIMQCFVSLTDMFNSQHARDQDACTYVLVAKVVKQ